MSISKVKAKIQQILSIEESPHRIALTFAVGVFIAFSPLIGLHTLMALSISWFFKLNLVIIMTGAFMNNPWTIAPIFGFSFLLGKLIMGDNLSTPAINWSTISLQDMITGTQDIFSALIQFNFKEIWDKLKHLILPFTIGSTILGIIFALISYFILKGILEKRKKQA